MSIRDLILPIAIRRRPHQYRHLLTTFGNADFQITDINSGEFREAITKAARSNLAWQAFNASGDDAGVASGAPRAARAPRAAETGNAPPDRTTPASSGAGRGTRGDG